MSMTALVSVSSDILVKYVIDSCVLCVDNNKTKSIENHKYESKLVQTFKLKLSVAQMSPHVLVGQVSRIPGGPSGTGSQEKVGVKIGTV